MSLSSSLWACNSPEPMTLLNLVVVLFLSDMHSGVGGVLDNLMLVFGLKQQAWLLCFILLRVLLECSTLWELIFLLSVFASSLQSLPIQHGQYFIVLAVHFLFYLLIFFFIIAMCLAWQAFHSMNSLYHLEWEVNQCKSFPCGFYSSLIL